MKNLPEILWATRDPLKHSFSDFVYLWDKKPKCTKHGGWNVEGSTNIASMPADAFRFLTGFEVPASATECIKLEYAPKGFPCSVSRISIHPEPTLNSLDARVRRLEEADE